MAGRRRAFSLAACIALAIPAFGAENPLDGTYSGERVLTAGDPAACAAKGAVSIDIHGERLTFTSNAVKDYAIGFFPRADGSFGELSSSSAGNVVAIHGHVAAGVLDSDVISAHCTHHWHLVKQR